MSFHQGKDSGGMMGSFLLQRANPGSGFRRYPRRKPIEKSTCPLLLVPGSRRLRMSSSRRIGRGMMGGAQKTGRLFSWLLFGIGSVSNRAWWTPTLESGEKHWSRLAIGGRLEDESNSTRSLEGNTHIWGCQRPRQLGARQWTWTCAGDYWIM